MATFTYEAILVVSDYGDDFDGARDDHAAAIKQFEEAANEQGITYHVISVAFTDFDSSNPSHACAYFDVEYEAEQEVREDNI